MTLGPEFQLIRQAAQQSYRFFLIVDGIHVAYISDVGRPSYSIATQEYKLLNYFFKYPKKTFQKYTFVSSFVISS